MLLKLSRGSTTNLAVRLASINPVFNSRSRSALLSSPNLVLVHLLLNVYVLMLSSGENASTLTSLSTHTK